MNPRKPAFFAHAELRGGQMEMLEDCRLSLAADGHHLAAAPTGIGKTAAALAAGLEAARRHPEQRSIFFLTGRQSQHRIVVETLRDINRRLPAGELDIRCVDIIGHASMCKEIDPYSGRCACEQGLPVDLRDSGRRELRDAILANPMHVGDVVARARKLRICAWATARSAVRDADVVICDYNHFFIDAIRERSLPAMDVALSRTILIVDEAHSLPSRIRKGLERRLTSRMLQHAKSELDEFVGNMGKGVPTNWAWVMTAMIQLRKTIGEKFLQWSSELSESDDGEMRIEVSDVFELIKQGLARNEWDEEPQDAMMRLSLLLKQVQVEKDDVLENGEELACWSIADLFETMLRFQTGKGMVLVFSTGKVTGLTSYLLDPGLVSQPVFRESAGSISMSGTLYPPRMYADMLGISEIGASSMAEYQSPFERNRRPAGVAMDVTTLYKHRGPKNTGLIVDHVLAISAEAPGHIAVFVPSYKLLEEFIEQSGWPGRTVIIEESRWSKKHIDRLLDDLEKYRAQGIKVLLAGVFRGKLSEGIDYRNNLLDAVVCIGIPLAPPSIVSTALREYLEDKFGRGKGWLYGSVQPAVNSVIQAMGRAIRSSEDRAFLMLLDRRHEDRGFSRCHPKGFSPLQCSDSEVTRRYAARFFARFPSES